MSRFFPILTVLCLFAVAANADLITITANNDNAIDAFIKSKSNVADTAFDYTAGDNATDAVIVVDSIDTGSTVHGLLGFTNLIGNGANQIAADSTVSSAVLKLWLVNDRIAKDPFECGLYEDIIPLKLRGGVLSLNKAAGLWKDIRTFRKNIYVILMNLPTRFPYNI